MVKNGAARPGSLTSHLPPLGAENSAAIAIYNRLDGEIRFPDVIYEIMLTGIGDPELMLERLHAIRNLKKEWLDAQRAGT